MKIGGVTQGTGHLLCKSEALSSNSSLPPAKKTTPKTKTKLQTAHGNCFTWGSGFLLS
jgi:hypothetical protein